MYLHHSDFGTLFWTLYLANWKMICRRYTVGKSMINYREYRTLFKSMLLVFLNMILAMFLCLCKLICFIGIFLWECWLDFFELKVCMWGRNHISLRVCILRAKVNFNHLFYSTSNQPFIRKFLTFIRQKLSINKEAGVNHLQYNY